ncbi:MAG: hypothetical protein KGD73_13700 [Candidatus Lokiarchaeota archaeon]|nr:hypothetical protein [Candidatus Lokiarchaeota archaeon]
MEDNRGNKKVSAQRVMIKDLEKMDIGSLVQIMGFVKEKIDEYINLDDKTGEITINIKKLKFPFKKGELVNVFTKIKPTMDGEKQFEAVFFQDMSNLNFEHFQKLYDMKKELIE